ncbi:MAG: polysaccharide deacetylase family protein, partial [Elusimicrobia bacterium]|nr:polysaccharide deacetylase family protein [Elusimicrobiota bacterium]
AVVTFDDGFQNNRDVAFPILRELGLPAAIFLTTDLIGSDETVWFCRLHGALMETSADSVEWRGRRLPLRDASERAAASAALQRSLKALPPAETETETAGIVRRLGHDPRARVEPGSPFRMLSERAASELVASGLIEMGAHTRRHRILSRLSSREKQEEIAGSVAAVTRLSGSTCRLFAYPNGQADDFDSEAVSLVVQAGVETAVTTVSGPNDAETPRLELRRYGVGQGMSDAMFRMVVHHAAHRLRR